MKTGISDSSLRKIAQDLGLVNAPFNLSRQDILKMDQNQLMELDQALGESLPHESYQDTADRLLLEEGKEDIAQLYEWMEESWFKE